MNSVHSLNHFWQLPIEERKHYYVSEEQVKDFPILDCREKLIDLEDLFRQNNLLIAYQPPEDIQNIIKNVRLRETAANKLVMAAKKLPRGFKFSISEGYRPLWYQKKCFDAIYADLSKQMNEASEKEIYDMTTTYIADPKLCPPHSTGGAMDITILDADENYLDMGASMNTVGEISHTFTNEISKNEQQNRQLLYDVLTSVGFVNLPSEWWHYSYGDQYWAIFNKREAALYDKIDVQ